MLCLLILTALASFSASQRDSNADLLRKIERHVDRSTNAEQLAAQLASIAEFAAQVASTESAEEHTVRRATALHEYVIHVADLPPDEYVELIAANELIAEADKAVLDARFADGVSLQREILETRERIVGLSFGASFEREVQLASLLNLSDQYEESIGYALDVIARSKPLLGEDNEVVVQALAHLAKVAVKRSRSEDAEAYLKDAEAMLDRLGTGGLAAQLVHNALRELYVNLGELDDALTHAALFLDSAEASYGASSPPYLQGSIFLSHILTARGDLIRSESVLERTRDVTLASQGEASFLIGDIDYLLAQIHLSKGEPHLALERLENAHAVMARAHGETSIRAMQVVDLMAGALHATGRAEEALPLAQGALERTMELRSDDHIAVRRGRITVSAILIDLGRIDEAEEWLDVAREPSDEHAAEDREWILFRAREDEYRGRIATLRGDLDGAAEAFRAALETQSEGRGDENADVIRLLVLAAEVETLRGDHEAARKLLEAAALDFEAARLKAGDGVERASFLERSPYGLLAWNQLALEDPDAAWQSVERRHGRALFDLLARNDQRLPPILSAAEVRAAIDENSALVGWLEVESELDGFVAYGWVLKPDGVVWRPLAGSREAARASAAALRADLAEAAERSFGRPSDVVVEREGRALYERYFAPLEDALAGIEQLIVVPPRSLVGVPLEALIDTEGETLDVRFLVSYTPSGSVHARLCGQKSSGEQSALLLGDPTFRDAAEGDESKRSGVPMLPGLPHSRREVEALAPLFEKSKLLLGEQASERELTRLATSGALAEYKVLHFATHARVDLVRPERCELILSQLDLSDPIRGAAHEDRIFDGRISAAEILSEWRLDADLVTLSACDTARGKLVSGEGAVGFAHAFFQAGARSLLLSLWPVDDEATSKLMSRFYAELVKPGATRARALRESKQWLRGQVDEDGARPYAHPSVWSAFVLFGAS